MHRIEEGQLTAIAFHEPGKLASEHRAALAEAAPDMPVDELLEYGRRVAADLDRGQVLS